MTELIIGILVGLIVGYTASEYVKIDMDKIRANFKRTNQ